MRVLKAIVDRVKKRNAAIRKKCYEEYGNKDGTCYGLVGGDRYTEYVQYGCVSCKYWRYYEGGNDGYVDELHYEYEPKFCPECGAKVESRIKALKRNEPLYTMAEICKMNGVEFNLRDVIDGERAADIQPASVIKELQEHIKQRILETAFNNGGIYGEVAEDIADRIDIWVDAFGRTKND